MMRILRFLTAAALLVLTATQAQATHAYGGEITWKCFTTGPNAGKFKFYMILYRDCGSGNAPLPGGTVILNSNSPAGNITLSQVGTNTDVSPTCYITPSPIRCNVAASGQGALEEARFESAFLNLNGTPPAGGWEFSYSLCCRPSTLTNLTNPGGANLYLRAVMYPFSINGIPQNTNPCYDSSPRFLEPPKSVICTGYEYTYAQFAFDDDLDSIYYDWAPSLNSNGATINYTTGYSATSPLPNGGVPPQLNNITGNITLTPSSGGSFATSIKVSAFRCGQKIAEVFRDIPMAIRSDCPNLPTGQPNTPPTLAITNIPGFPPITPVIINNDTAYYEATVFAGQQVRFNLVSQDPQLLPNFLPQTIAFQPSGGQFGVPLANSASGCLNPPCATVIPVAPQTTLSNPLNNEVLFNWQTNCDHVSSIGIDCGSPSTQYNFTFRMQDNFCPIPAYNLRTVVVNVVSTIAVPPDVSSGCVTTGASGVSTISWGYPVDTGMNFDSYIIYHATSKSGPFTVLDTIVNYSQLSYLHNAAGSGSNYYFLRSKGGCNSLSVPSDTLGNHFFQLQPQNFIAYSSTGWANFKCESSDTAATYQWQLYSGTVWNDLINLGHYSGVTTDSLVITGVTASMNNYGYRCIVTGCSSDTSDVAVLTVANDIGLRESTLDKLTISPNPTNGLVSLNISVVGNYELLTLDGRVLESGTAKKDYDLTTYPKGVYHLRLSTDEGTRVLKVVKN